MIVRGFFSTLRMYVTTCQISSSVIPTPCCVAPFGGIAVPGTPLLMVLKISASASPCFFGVRVRSGPRPPPCAPSPWQNAQFARNSNSPSFATLASPAYGFFPCAAIDKADTPIISDSASVAVQCCKARILISFYSFAQFRGLYSAAFNSRNINFGELYHQGTHK